MFYIVLIFGIIIDLYTKNLAYNYLQVSIDIIPYFIYFQYVENTGIAFSVYIPLLVLKLLTIVLTIAIFFYYFYEKKSFGKKGYLLDISFGLILAGAIGNGYERVFNEKVIDFIGVNYFAVFNMADSFISIGAFLYLLFLYIYKMRPVSTETGLKNNGG